MLSLLGVASGRRWCDVAGARGFSALMSVLLLVSWVGAGAGAGAQQFGAPTTYPLTGLLIGSSPQAVATGDFNGDGKKDLVVGYSGPGGSVDGRLAILLGNGDGTFTPFTSFSSGGGEPDAIVVRDFNRDGIADLAVANYGGGSDNNASVAVLFGRGDGQFDGPQVYKTEKLEFGRAEASGLAVGDFNGDGKLDLAVTENPSGVAVFLGKGKGKFAKPVVYATDVLPSSVVVKDFNHDGKQDLAVANSNSDDVSVLLGNGDGTFGAPMTFPAGPGPSAVKSRDLNGDGIPDLVIANSGSSFGTTVSVLLGVGDGTFQAPVSYAAGAEPTDVVIRDFDGDGKLDLAVADVNAGDQTAEQVSLLLGKGDGTFGPPTSYVAGAGPVSLVALRLNRGCHPDLAVANFFGNSVSVLRNTATGECPGGRGREGAAGKEEDDEDGSE